MVYVGLYRDYIGYILGLLRDYITQNPKPQMPFSLPKHQSNDANQP